MPKAEGATDCGHFSIAVIIASDSGLSSNKIKFRKEIRKRADIVYCFNKNPSFGVFKFYAG